MNVLAGIAGSASGGMSIAPQMLGEQFATLALGGFDALPHDGAVITLPAITGLTHRKSYGNIFVVPVTMPVTIPVLATIVLIILGSLG